MSSGGELLWFSSSSSLIDVVPKDNKEINYGFEKAKSIKEAISIFILKKISPTNNI